MPNLHLQPYQHASAFRKVAAVAWREPSDPTIHGSVEVRAERLLSWIDLKRRETGERITVTHAVVRALALTLRRYPECNALVRRGRPQRRRDVDIFAQVAIDKGGTVGGVDLSGVCIRQADGCTVTDIARQLGAGAAAARAGEDPAFLRTKRLADTLPAPLLGAVLRTLRFLQVDLNIDTTFLGAPRDPFGSAAVTSLGMMGIRVAYAPFFPLAASPLLVMVGAVEDRPVVEDGQLAVGKVLFLNATCDHRVIDGVHAALLAREMQRLLEYPRLLEEDGERDHMLGGAVATSELPTLNPDSDSLTLESPTSDSGLDEVSLSLLTDDGAREPEHP